MLLASTIVIAGDATIHEPKLPIYKSFGLRATTGLMYHKYSGLIKNEKFSDNIPFVGIGATINVGHLSLDGYAQHSDKGKDGSFSIGTRGAVNEEAMFDREDYAITVGYQIGEPIFSLLPKKFSSLSFLRNFSVSAGYKWSETNIDVTQIALKYEDITRTEIQFKTTGPFVGINYIHPFGKNRHHKLGMYVAYGRLEGDYSSSSFKNEQPIPYGDPNVVSPTEAIKYGFSLNGLLTKLAIGKFTYRISFDSYDYTMDLENSRGIVDNPSIEEKLYSLNASLYWVFD